MVKIINQLGDVKKGKQHTAVYQNIYGNQMRRTLKDKKDEHTRGQLEQRERFKVGIDFAKGLTKAQRDFIKSYMAEKNIRSPEGLPTTWYSFTKRIAMTKPKVEMEVEITGEEFSATYAYWSYRKAITLNNSGSALSNYQVLITLTTENFSYAKCKNDGSDLRFSKDDKTTPLNYWIQDWNYNGTSKLWVKVDSIPTGENICLYLYYGNEAATSESNGNNTFELFDDFEGTSLDTDKWDTIGTPAISISNSILTMTCNATEYIESKNFTKAPPAILEARTKDKNYGANNYPACYGFGKYHSTTYDTYGVRREIKTAAQYELAACDLSGRDITSGISRNTSFAIYKIEWASDICHLYEDGVKKDVDDITTHIPTNALKAIIGRTFYTAEASTFDIDWLFIRKYISPKPTVNIEEQEVENSTPTLKALKIKHTAIESYKIMKNESIITSVEGISNLEDHISTITTRINLDLKATKIIVKTLANQEYEFIVK